MRLPRTTRQWMKVILIIGVVMGSIIGGQRHRRWSRHYRDRAESHRMMVDIRRVSYNRDHAPDTLKAIDYLAAMARKYRDAARSPWIAFASNPPELE